MVSKLICDEKLASNLTSHFGPAYLEARAVITELKPIFYCVEDLIYAGFNSYFKNDGIKAAAA